MVDYEGLVQLLQRAQESRGHEFKSAGDRSDKRFVALVARAVLALANQRDGGLLIIGFDEGAKFDDQQGLSEAQLEWWSNVDDVLPAVNRYCDPPLDITIETVCVDSRFHVAVLTVPEFDTVPVLCKKGFDGVLDEGALYTRSLVVPSSRATLTSHEMRELLDVAVAKGLRRFVQAAERSGLTLSAADNRDDALDAALTATVELLPRLSSERPLMKFGFALPVPNAEDAPVRDPLALVNRSEVRLRGWTFPFVGTELRRGQGWVGSAVEFLDHLEAWRLERSAVFSQCAHVDTAKPGAGAEYATDGDTGFVPLWSPLLHYTEAFIFASRFLSNAGFGGRVRVIVEIAGLKGWVLVGGDPRRGSLHGHYRYEDETWSESLQLDATRLIAEPRKLAREVCARLFSDFGFAPVSLDLLESVQTDSLGRED